MSIASRTQLMRELSNVVGHYVNADRMDEIIRYTRSDPKPYEL